jgi:hypothetical protein
MTEFDTYFDVDELSRYHHVIVMRDFMKYLAKTVWPAEKRAGMCGIDTPCYTLFQCTVGRHVNQLSETPAPINVVRPMVIRLVHFGDIIKSHFHKVNISVMLYQMHTMRIFKMCVMRGIDS